MSTALAEQAALLMGAQRGRRARCPAFVKRWGLCLPCAGPLLPQQDRKVRALVCAKLDQPGRDPLCAAGLWRHQGAPPSLHQNLDFVLQGQGFCRGCRNRFMFFFQDCAPSLGSSVETGGHAVLRVSVTCPSK
jgi:hypothetical protein